MKLRTKPAACVPHLPNRNNFLEYTMMMVVDSNIYKRDSISVWSRTNRFPAKIVFIVWSTSNKEEYL